jgi:hypothetical protein
MNKLKTKLLAHKILTGVMSLVVAVSLIGVAVAYRGDKAPKVVVEGDYIEAQEVLPPVEELVDLGAVSNPHLLGPEFGVGKDLRYSVSAALTDATSTWAFPSPFRAATSTASDVVVETLATGYGLTVATTTVELVRMSFTSSTPTGFEVGCASSNNQFTTSTNGEAILTSTAVGAARGKFVVENDLVAAEGADIGGGTVEKIMMGPSHPWIVCRVYTSAAGEWSGADGVSPGDIVIRFSRVQN